MDELKIERIKRELADVPTLPGVYLWKDADGQVIYVGKAKDLRKRAGSYFLHQAEIDDRTKFLVRDIRDIDYIQALSEVDALLMEARLIKDIQHVVEMADHLCQ